MKLRRGPAATAHGAVGPSAAAEVLPRSPPISPAPCSRCWKPGGPPSSRCGCPTGLSSATAAAPAREPRRRHPGRPGRRPQRPGGDRDGQRGGGSGRQAHRPLPGPGRRPDQGRPEGPDPPPDPRRDLAQAAGQRVLQPAERPDPGHHGPDRHRPRDAGRGPGHHGGGRGRGPGPGGRSVLRRMVGPRRWGAHKTISPCLSTQPPLRRPRSAAGAHTNHQYKLPSRFFQG